MNNPNVPNPMLERSPEPFDEVWMYPKGWDLSEMEKTPPGASQARSAGQATEYLFSLPVKLTV